ncbi:hypothetical protein CLOM_g13746 [Closterium sp. NIES-68]|nr:hypothetical protein CLOM_g13746 [Closterium sp. NIES-68]
MRPGDDVKPVLDKIKDTYARMAAAGSSVSQLQQCTKIISVLDNSWDNLIPTLNSQQDQWTPEWLRQQILQEDFRRRHVGGGAATKTAEGAPSLSGNRYFLTIVDDHTRAVWVYPLKSKGEVAAAVLTEWMPRAQRECGHKVKVIRSDNGGEFIGADFEGELKRKGIQHQLTVPYNPQQNGEENLTQSQKVQSKFKNLTRNKKEQEKGWDRKRGMRGKVPRESPTKETP